MHNAQLMWVRIWHTVLRTTHAAHSIELKVETNTEMQFIAELYFKAKVQYINVEINIKKGGDLNLMHCEQRRYI